MLTEGLTSELNEAFVEPIEAENLGCSNIDELERKLMTQYYTNQDSVFACSSDQSNEQLNSFLTDDNLSQEEAIFCLLGLNIDSIPHDFSVHNITTKNNNQILDYFISKTEEYRKLEKAIKIKEKTNLYLTSDGDIHTEGFISWAVNKGFIEENTEATKFVEQKLSNIEQHNTKLKEIRDHNTKVIVDCYHMHDTKNISKHAFITRDKYYNKYKDQLFLFPKSKNNKERLVCKLTLYKYLKAALNPNI